MYTVIWPWYGQDIYFIPFLVYDCLKFFSFLLNITSVFVLGPLVRKLYLMRKIWKFRDSREFGGLNFGLWLEKKFFWGSMAIRFAWCNMNTEQSSLAQAWRQSNVTGEGKAEKYLGSQINFILIFGSEDKIRVKKRSSTWPFAFFRAQVALGG